MLSPENFLRSPAFCLVLTSVFVCSSCSQVGVVMGSPPAELKLPEAVQVRFNHRDGARFRSPLTGKWRNGDDLEAFLIESVNESRSELLVAVQELTLPGLAKALVAAQRRGVAVKLVMDNNYSLPWSKLHDADLSSHQRLRLRRLTALADRNGDGKLSREERDQGDAVAMLKRHGIPLIDDREDGSRGSGLMHHKFVVIDRRRVITGSANFTSSGVHGDAGSARSRGNVNHLLSFDAPDLAALFRSEFLQMWGDGPGGATNSRFGRQKDSVGIQGALVGDTKVEVLFAPHSPKRPDHGLRWIATQLEQGTKTIDMALFVFSEQSLANALGEHVNRGVAVRLLADPGFASRSYSEVLDLLGLSIPDRLCRLEAGNSPLRKPLEGVGIPRLSRGDKLHHKFAVIDNKKVITGSFNWSPSAAHTNDETLLVIHSRQLAQHFTREMNRMWRGAELGISPRIRQKLQRQRLKCGSGEQRQQDRLSVN